MEHLMKQQQNTHFSQVYMEHPPIQTILGHLKPENKSYIIKKIEIVPSTFSDHKEMKLENEWQKNNQNIHKYVEIKRHIPEQIVGQSRHHKENQKIPCTNEIENTK